MDVISLIEKKKRKEHLTASELNQLVGGLMNGEIEEYKFSSLLMAIALNGMDIDEIYNLTMAMLNSGTSVDLSDVEGVCVDKHSTGGVGDSTTLVIAPILACLGVKFVKMSGRALGHTGGTIDKLESFAGYKADISTEEFKEIVATVGTSIISQTKELVPADKKIYALRDVTATVDSIPLIASSIMSKKLATGVGTIFLDVKYGNGAFIKDASNAVNLAKIMVEIGTRAGRNVQAVVSRMSEPLSNAIGCNLEVREVLEVLRGKECSLGKLSFFIAARILMMNGIVASIEEAYQKIRDIISSGEAFEKLKQMVSSHGGSTAAFEDIDVLKTAPISLEMVSDAAGEVTAIDALKIGQLVSKLGAGRQSKDAEINHEVGVRLLVNVGDIVEIDTPVAEIYATTDEDMEYVKQQIVDVIKINGEKTYNPLVYAYVTSNGIEYDKKIKAVVEKENAVMEYNVELNMESEEYKYKAVVEKIEHTLLSQLATPEMLQKHCTEAMELGFYGVCVLPTHIRECCYKYLPKDTTVKVISVVGFPYGEELIPIKIAQTKKAVMEGADEIDMVISISKVKRADYKYITKEISSVVKAAKKKPVKVILETSYLTDDEIKQVVTCAVAAKAMFIKTSTGLFGQGATMEKIKVIKETLTSLGAKTVGIKASGGIKTAKDVYAMLNAGATRIGTSNGIAIAKEIRAKVDDAKDEATKPKDII